MLTGAKREKEDEEEIDRDATEQALMIPRSKETAGILTERINCSAVTFYFYLFIFFPFLSL